MTGTNYTLDAARNGQKRPRQLLGKERLAAGNPFFLLTAHANGRPVYDGVAINDAVGLHLVDGGDDFFDNHADSTAS
jgi:hypothetical protein